MASTLAALLKHCGPAVSRNLVLSSKIIIGPPCVAVRCLFSKAALGIDGYLLQRERTKTQFSHISEKFRDKMQDYTNDESKSMIFTEDLKNMVHIAETDQDFETVIKMLKKFNAQNKELRFGSFVFGPVVMRLFYVFNKPDLAYECFKSPQLIGFFDQLMSYQILLDLLYEHKKYNEILEALKLITDRQVEGTKYPKNAVVLTLAACYKLNTPESFKYALDLWQDLMNVGHLPTRRASTFCAALALNQNNPAACIEMLTAVRNQSYTTVRNLKVAALSQLGRLDDAIVILKSIIKEDMPVNVNIVHTFNREIIEEVKKSVEILNDPDITSEFTRLVEIFEKEGRISNMTMDEQLCSEIQKSDMDKRDKDQFRKSNFKRDTPRYNQYNLRPGLHELQ